MTEIDLIFYTYYHEEGYQLGINMLIAKNLTDNEHRTLYNKIVCVFKTFYYGMDIVKIAEILKTVLINSGIKEEEVSRLEISFVNKKHELQSNDICYVRNGSLPNFIYEHDLYRDRETCGVIYDKGQLTNYYYTNILSKFLYNNKQVVFNCDELPENSRKRNGLLNRFFKHNLETIKQLENINAKKTYLDININDSILVTAYKIFYNELPDFNDPNILTKFQCMAAIIHTSVFAMFPIITECNYCNKKITTPESKYIKDQIFKMNLLLGNDFSKVETFNFKPGNIAKIAMLGETIRNYMLQLPEEERIEFLNQFTIDYLHTCYQTFDKVNEKSQELLLLLTKKDTKN